MTELHRFEDGILVKTQKETQEKEGVPKKAQTAQLHPSNLSLTPQAEGGYTFGLGTSEGTLEISAT